MKKILSIIVLSLCLFSCGTSEKTVAPVGTPITVIGGDGFFTVYAFTYEGTKYIVVQGRGTAIVKHSTQ